MYLRISVGNYRGIFMGAGYENAMLLGSLWTGMYTNTLCLYSKSNCKC